MDTGTLNSVRTEKIAALAKELVKEGELTSDQLAVVLESQKNLGGDLGEILIRRGFLSEAQFNQRVAKLAGIQAASLANYKPSPELLSALTASQAHSWQMVPFDLAVDKITLATADPFDFRTLEEAKVELGREFECVLVGKKELQAAIKTHYRFEDASVQAKPAVEVLKFTGNPADMRNPKPAAQRSAPPAQITDAEQLKTVTIVDELLERAFNEKASDIHMDPLRDGLTVRVRIDGILEPIKTLPLTMQQSVLSRIKILGGMDVAEHRIPQDGRARLHIRGKELDIRISTFPTIHGEAAAIRLLSKENLLTLEDMGFLGNDREIFEKLILKPHGIFLVTGPTGSGKTTTLYAALNRIDRQKNRVLTVEDPVENEIDGVNQTQINVKAGVTFPTVIRAMLREDPDVIMVGEIRDKETAEASIRAAMTGHLVLSTLHTNTAIGAIARLVDMGLETYVVSSTLIGVMAQRLVRRICKSCKTETTVPPEFLRKFPVKAVGLRAYTGRGCKECGMRGYKGRVGLFELVTLDDEFRVLINNKAPEVRLKEKAAMAGSKTIFEDGLEKIKQGITTIEEVLRVTGEL